MVATLSLEVTGVPGTYQVTFVDGQLISEEMIEGVITPGAALSILVQAD